MYLCEMFKGIMMTARFLLIEKIKKKDIFFVKIQTIHIEFAIILCQDI